MDILLRTPAIMAEFLKQGKGRNPIWISGPFPIAILIQTGHSSAKAYSFRECSYFINGL